MADDDLVEMAEQEIEKLDLARADKVKFGFVVRVHKAYPIYDVEYAERVATIRGWLDGIPNLTQVGRNGLHRYNNSDHSMLTAMRAVDNILLGTHHDIWAVNAESVYHEEHVTDEQPYRERSGDARDGAAARVVGSGRLASSAGRAGPDRCGARGRRHWPCRPRAALAARPSESAGAGLPVSPVPTPTARRRRSPRPTDQTRRWQRAERRRRARDRDRRDRADRGDLVVHLARRPPARAGQPSRARRWPAGGAPLGLQARAEAAQAEPGRAQAAQARPGAVARPPPRAPPTRRGRATAARLRRFRRARPSCRSTVRGAAAPCAAISV